jgi:(p)ppGpp synthase/HD superfamily hydrolase
LADWRSARSWAALAPHALTAYPSTAFPPSMHGYSDRINHAFAFAAKHYGALAPTSDTMAYLASPANVAVILARYACDQPTLVAGILHFVLEEAPPARRATLEGKIAEKFGPVVLAIARDACEPRYDVRGSERPWRTRKNDFLAHLAVADPRALDIIAADEIHRCGTTLTALRRLGVEYLRAVSQANSEQTVWWYRSMLEILASRPDWPQRAMLEEIRTVSADLVRSLLAHERGEDDA